MQIGLKMYQNIATCFECDTCMACPFFNYPYFLFHRLPLEAIQMFPLVEKKPKLKNSVDTISTQKPRVSNLPLQIPLRPSPPTRRLPPWQRRQHLWRNNNKLPSRRSNSLGTRTTTEVVAIVAAEAVHQSPLVN